MKTDDLIRLLARDAGPAPRGVVAGRLGAAALFGIAASVVLAGIWVGYVPASTYAWPAPWFKLVYAAALALAAAALTGRLARAAAPGDAAAAAAGAVVLVAAVLGLAAWSGTPPDERTAGLLGHSWSRCPVYVLALSLPALGALLWALRGLAPTRLRAAGFAAGLLAGAIGAGGYALACTELAVSFVAAWYTLGMLLAAVLGALLAPRLLRW
jgi:hypothetical protein